MKLEINNNLEQDSFNNYSYGFDFKENRLEDLLREGVEMAQQGNRAKARYLLLFVAEAEPENETAWLWLASISEYPEELLIFLQNVLKVNPQNERAISWAKETKSLLAKTFVHRGIDASHQNQTDFARQCFLQAIVHEAENEMAWLWLASMTESVEEKMLYLQKVLNFNPQNETALTSLNELKKQIVQAQLRKANSAAIAGDKENARNLLEKIMENSPELEEAWILKAYLSDGFYEKLNCYEKVLELNPQNEAAQAGMSSLKILIDKSENKPEFTQQLADFDSSNHQSQDFSPAAENPQEDSEETLNLSENSQEFSENSQETSEKFHESSEDTQEIFANTQETFVNSSQETSANSQDSAANLADESIQLLDVELSPADFSYSENDLNNSDFFEQIAETESPAPENNDPVNYWTQNTQINEPEFPANENNFSSEEFQNSTENEEFHSENPTQKLEENFVEETEFSPAAETEVEIVEAHSEENSFFFQSETTEFSPEPEKISENYLIDDTQIPNSYEPSREEYSANNFVSSNEVAENPFETVAETAQTNADVSEENSSNEFPANDYYEQYSAKEYFAAEDQPTVDFSQTEVSPIFINQSADPIAENYAFENSADELNEVREPAQEYSTEEVSLPNESEFVETYTEIPAQTMHAECPFCGFSNETQTINCGSCRTMLSLSDLEMLLAHHEADQEVLAQSIQMMEEEKFTRGFDADELYLLGVAYLNAKNLRKGLEVLQEASKFNPNDVVLSSKVNFLAIRISEIEIQENRHSENTTVSRIIMVVDDSATVRKLISGKLEKSGHSVVTAVDGIEALSKINERVPDLILLDITMPQMDGYQVCKMIRSNDATKEIPVVMISGKDGFFDKVRGRMAGSTDYITKPFGPETLMKTIETYLN